MKNLKYFGIIGLGCGLLFLTGCGSSDHTLKCEKTDDTMTSSLEVVFNSDETNVDKINVTESYPAPEGTPKEEIEVAKNMLEEDCNLYLFENCSAKISDNKVIVTYSADTDKLGINNGTLEDVQEQIEKLGYTCE